MQGVGLLCLQNLHYLQLHFTQSVIIFITSVILVIWNYLYCKLASMCFSILFLEANVKEINNNFIALMKNHFLGVLISSGGLGRPQKLISIPKLVLAVEIALFLFNNVKPKRYVVFLYSILHSIMDMSLTWNAIYFIQFAVSSPRPGAANVEQRLEDLQHDLAVIGQIAGLIASLRQGYDVCISWFLLS